MSKHPYGKPPKEYATVVQRDGNWVLIKTNIAVRRPTPTGGFRLSFEPIERTLDHREVKPSDWPLLRAGDKLRLPSKRGLRLWGRAMTPSRKPARYHFTFKVSSIVVEPVG